MEKDFDGWVHIKKQSHLLEARVLFKERDVWWCRLGANIGDEQDGNGDFFQRPVLVIKKFNKKVFVGLPFSTKVKDNNYLYHAIEFLGRKQSVIMPQIRMLDSKRLMDRIGVINEGDFEAIKEKTKALIF